MENEPNIKPECGDNKFVVGDMVTHRASGKTGVIEYVYQRCKNKDHKTNLDCMYGRIYNKKNCKLIEIDNYDISLCFGEIKRNVPGYILNKMTYESDTKPQDCGAIASKDLLGRRIYACLSASESLEAAAQCVLQHRAANGDDNYKYMNLLDKCRKKSNEARQDADAAMHELGIGYHQIYGSKEPNRNRVIVNGVSYSLGGEKTI